MSGKGLPGDGCDRGDWPRHGGGLGAAGRDGGGSRAESGQVPGGRGSIRQETGNPAVEYVQADLSAQAEVRRFAEEFQRSHPRLDVLVNNVGAFFMSRRLSADGIEMTWALNYLGVYLLTELLLDTLMASAPGAASSMSRRPCTPAPDSTSTICRDSASTAA